MKYWRIQDIPTHAFLASLFSTDDRRSPSPTLCHRDVELVRPSLSEEAFGFPLLPEMLSFTDLDGGIFKCQLAGLFKVSSAHFVIFDKQDWFGSRDSGSLHIFAKLIVAPVRGFDITQVELEDRWFPFEVFWLRSKFEDCWVAMRPFANQFDPKPFANKETGNLKTPRHRETREAPPIAPRHLSEAVVPCRGFAASRLIDVYCFLDGPVALQCAQCPDDNETLLKGFMDMLFWCSNIGNQSKRSAQLR